MGRLVQAATFTIVLVIASTSAAEPAASQGRVEVVADSVELDRQQGRAVFSGSVRLSHGGVSLSCEQLVATISESGAITAIVATGNVRIRAGGGVSATAGHARYEPGPRRVLLSGNPIVTAPGGQIRGQSISMDLSEGGRITVRGARGVFSVQ